MHRSLLCGIMCVSVCFCFQESVLFLCVCAYVFVCLWTHSCATVQSACQPSQGQPELTGAGERVGLAHSRHATSLLYMYLMEKHTELPGETNVPVSAVQGQNRKSSTFLTDTQGADLQINTFSPV